MNQYTENFTVDQQLEADRINLERVKLDVELKKLDVGCTVGKSIVWSFSTMISIVAVAIVISKTYLKIEEMKCSSA